MNLERKIFRAFVETHSLGTFIDFKTRTTFVTGLNQNQLAEDIVRSSVEFAGFSDGFQGLPSRFRNQDQRSSQAARSFQRGLADLGVEHLPGYSGTNQERYERQYALGMKCKK